MTKKRRVCHVTTVHWAKDVRIYSKECLSLAAAGCEVHLIAQDRGESEIDGVIFHGLKACTKSRPYRMWYTVNEAYEKIKAVDAEVYHFHDPELLRLVPKVKKLGKKIVYDVHEDLPRQILSKYYIKPFLRKIVAVAVQSYEDRRAAQVDCIIAATPTILERFAKLNPRTCNVNNYPIEMMFFPLEDVERKRQICYVGGISRIRGMHELLDAVSLLPEDINLVLAGPFSDPTYEEELRAHPSWSKVDYLGYISKEEVNRVYNESMVGIVLLLPVPNHVDALPMKMFEYMSAGLPVLASDFELWRTIVLGGDAGLVANPVDAQEVAEAIMKIIDDKEMASRFSKNGVSLIKTKYNWQNESRNLIKCYDRMFAENEQTS